MKKDNNELTSAGEFLLYQTEDGRTRIECRFEEETLWLTQAQMAELFQVTVPTINEHLKGIFSEGELEEGATIRKFRIVRLEGSRQVTREIDHYNLPAILAVGYRVRSYRGTQFRQWATEQLQEYLLKGFVLDDKRLKNPPGPGTPDYFDELLARIRDIRSSEKVFWRKVLDIYATSIDYESTTETTQQFFATVQNKMHWAVHGQTAAEIIASRADASQPNMGMTSWLGERPRKDEASIAKNYLAARELDELNRIVNAYLEFAELRALNRKPMYMADWVTKLNEFLGMSEHEILDHAGKVSHETALAKVELEYEKFNVQQLTQFTRVEQDFERAIKNLSNKPLHKKANKKKGAD